MTDPLQKLRRRNARQKSDVAQKLVAMCLHELSSRLVRQVPALLVESPAYVEAVRQAFGTSCAFCAAPLTSDGDTHVEHLDAMNRRRGGLHVAGNVLLACKSCNFAKRRDDQSPVPPRGKSGWDSFVSHVGSCPPGCRNCRHWRERYPEDELRARHLSERLRLIRSFRARYGVDSLTTIGRTLASSLEGEYRRLQGHVEVLADGWADNHLSFVLDDVRRPTQDS